MFRAMSQKSQSSLPLIVALALVVVVVGALVLRQRLAPERHSAEGATSAEPVSGVHAGVVQALEQGHHRADGQKVRAACASAPESCPCRTEAAHRALDRGLGKEALAVIQGADGACRASLAGEEAEALARAGQAAAADTAAAAVLSKDASNGYASYALAEAAYKRGQADQAEAMARQAVGRGRGAPAHLLLGLIAFRKKDLATAKTEFEAMLGADPKDVDALFNLGVVAGAQNQYREAREKYLEVLRVEPEHADARFNLALLTHSVGAGDEARHHLEKLEELLGPSDDRVVRLKGILGVTQAAPGASGAP